MLCTTNAIYLISSLIKICKQCLCSTGGSSLDLPGDWLAPAPVAALMVLSFDDTGNYNVVEVHYCQALIFRTLLFYTYSITCPMKH